VAENPSRQREGRQGLEIVTTRGVKDLLGLFRLQRLHLRTDLVRRIDQIGNIGHHEAPAVRLVERSMYDTVDISHRLMRTTLPE